MLVQKKLLLREGRKSGELSKPQPYPSSLHLTHLGECIRRNGANSSSHETYRGHIFFSLVLKSAGRIKTTEELVLHVFIFSPFVPVSKVKHLHKQNTIYLGVKCP